MEHLNSYWNCQVISSLYQVLCPYRFPAHMKCLTCKLINDFVARGRLRKMFKIEIPGCFVKEETIFYPKSSTPWQRLQRYNGTYTGQHLKNRKKNNQGFSLLYFSAAFYVTVSWKYYCFQKRKQKCLEKSHLFITHEKSLSGNMPA